MAKPQIKATSVSDFDPIRWLVQESIGILNEDGDDGEDADGDPESDEDDTASDESGSETEGGTPEKKPFENLELVDCTSFGWCRKAADNCWANIADSTVSKGWSDDLAEKIDANLEKDVDASYYFLTVGVFRDLDTEYEWRASFVNKHCMWKLELAEGSAAVLPEDAASFFGCEYFKKFSKRAADLAVDAVRIYDEIVDRHIRSGELLKANPEKLEMLLRLVKNTRAMQNFRDGKYEMN